MVGSTGLAFGRRTAQVLPWISGGDTTAKLELKADDSERRRHGAGGSRCDANLQSCDSRWCYVTVESSGATSTEQAVGDLPGEIIK